VSLKSKEKVVEMTYKLEEIINTVICGDALEELKKFPDECVDMVITSPPYYGLRDYQVEGQWGLEKTIDEYLEKLKALMLELKRVLKPTGTIWWNHGDTYGGTKIGNTNASTGGIGKPRYSGEWTQTFKKSAGKPKCLLMIPERFALMCIEEVGLILRNKIIWHKPNSMPSSVKDRFSNTWEYLYLFSKKKKYFFDLDAVRVKSKTGDGAYQGKRTGKRFGFVASPQGIPSTFGKELRNYPLGKNPGDVIKLSPKYLLGKGHTNRQGLNRSLSIVTIKAYKEYQEPIAKFLKKHIKKEHKPILDKIFGKHRWPHWTRTDLSGAALPGVKDWVKLKEILNLKETPFDEMIYEIQKLNIPNFQCGRNPGDFWSITTQPFKEAHFAVFPEKLCERPILAGCPRWVCKKCSKPRVRITKPTEEYAKLLGKSWHNHKEDKIKGMWQKKTVANGSSLKSTTAQYETIGLTKCDCNAGFQPGIVLDPFCGSGTALVVAKKLGRNFIGIDIKPEYCEMARRRLAKIPEKLIEFVGG